MTESMRTSRRPAGQATDGGARETQHRHALTLSPVTMAERVLPDSPVPVALGVGALALAGLVEWPVAGAIGLGYLAIRTWRARPAQQA
jgi:hypothetical protein